MGKLPQTVFDKCESKHYQWIGEAARGTEKKLCEEVHLRDSDSHDWNRCEPVHSR